ncbi:MAG TPA: efflux RND transporter periplasmic adaptor subunit [Myxococcota bacterium]|nr:efflux RND transporter periplasmic adaptor subunit [Myxococcota bacterium]HQK50346.1 efflux RND transporter periplasmic adaptor subunit [Myxococcota bacterium]
MSPGSENPVATMLDRERRSRRRRRLWIGGAAVVALAAGLVAWSVTRSREALEASQRFRTEAITRGDLRVTVTATGTIQAKDTVDVGAEVTGRLVEVRADFNEEVHPGDVLARIDPVPFELEVAQAEARLQNAQAGLLSAKAALEQARITKERQEALAQDGLASPQTLDEVRAAFLRARADLALAQARVAEAQAALQASRTRLSKTVIASPIGGIVLDRKVEVGQTVTAGFQTPVLFTLARDLSQMELLVSVDEADVTRVREGTEATFTVDAWPGRVFPSHVSSIRNVPRTVQNVVTYEAILTVDNQDRVFRPGMTATASLNVQEASQVLRVPSAALRFQPPATPDGSQKKTSPVRLPMMMGPPRMGPRGDRPSDASRNAVPGSPARVFVLRDGVPTPVTFTRGLSDGSFVEVRDGDLHDGDLVVVGMTKEKAR